MEEETQSGIAQAQEIATTPIQTVELPPSEVAENPFGVSEEPPFENVDEIVSTAPTNSTVSTPMRSMTAALAMMSESNATDPMDVVLEMQKNLELADQLLASGSEYQLQLDSAARQSLARDQALRNLPNTDPIISEELGDAIQMAADVNRRQNLQELAKTALEEEAIKNVIHLYETEGDSVEFRMALNQLKPEMATTAGVIQDHAMSALLITNAIERAGLQEEEEGFWNKFLTAVVSVPEAILLGDMFQLLGNMSEGVGGYKKDFWSFLTPGSEMGDQIAAFQSMNAAEKAEALPQLLENIKGNSTTLGLTDPGRQEALLSMFQEGISSHEMFARNAFTWLDMGGIIPFGRVARGTEMLVGLGARKAAAERVAMAVDHTIQNGAEFSIKATGVGVDEIVDHALPAIVNPQRLARPSTISTRARLTSTTGGATPVERVSVSLSGDISDTRMAAEVVAEHLAPMAQSVRWADESERAAAIQSAKNKAEEIAGVGLADVDVVPIKLPNGTVVERLEVILNKPFATEAEARGFLSSIGQANDPTSVVLKQVPVERQAIKATGTDDFRVVEERDTDIIDEARLDAAISTNDMNNFAEASVYKINLKKEGKDVDGELVIGKNGTAHIAIKYDPDADVVKIGPKAILELSRKLVKQFPQIKKFAGDRVGGVRENTERMGQYIEISARAANDDIVQDVSGAYFPRMSLDIAETAFYTSPLNPPRQSYISRFILNPSQTSDRRLFELQSEAGQKRNRLLKDIERNFLQSFRKLSSNDREYLKQVLMKGDNLQKWFTDREFATIWERATGSPPSEVAKTAYYQYRVNNDLEHVLRNADMYSTKFIRGFQSAKFNVMGDEIDVDVVVDYTPTSTPPRRSFNISDGIHYRNPGDLTKSNLEQMVDDGYIMFRTEMPVKLRDGTEIDHFLIKKSNIEISNLRRDQLAYRAGGHRLYADKYFVKQASRGVQPDTGKAFLRNPSVFITAPNVRNAKEWADKMNEARIAVKDKHYTAQQLDELIFQGQRGFPTGEDFIQGIETGRIGLDDPFEAVFDREMPTVYRHQQDVSQFVDEEELGFGGFYRSTGRMYYSRKGEALKDFTGDLAPTIDPFEAQAKALYNVAGLTSFSDFKTSAIDRWVRTYRDELNIKELPDDTRGSPVSVFNSVTVKRETPATLRAQIEGQRDSIKRVLNFQTDFDRHYDNWLREKADWLAMGDSKLSQWAAKAPLYLMDKNPVNFLRGFAFNLKLGMFNLGQLFIQTSTMASAWAMSPRFGTHGFGATVTLMPYLAARNLGTQENVLDVLAKRGAHRLAGFDDVKEYKEYVRHTADSGFYDFNDTHALMNSSSPSSTFAITAGVSKVQDYGRVFFNAAERMNRIVAHRIAYGEAVEQFGKKGAAGFEDAAFRRYVAGRAENYSFNMSQESRSAWQTGILSIPTQFWAYNVRMIEALIGKDFTLGQKVRLAAMQFGMAGTGGLPVVAAIQSYVNEQTGGAPGFKDVAGKPADPISATFQRGVFDLMVHELTGADVRIGEKWGTGDFSSDVIKNIFGLGQYGPMSVAEFMGGATTSILGNVIGPAAEFAYYWAAQAESGGEEVDLSKEQWIELARQISTVNNYMKARLAHEYGLFKTTSGATVIDGIPPQDAFFLALGFNPGETWDMEAASVHAKHRADAVRESAKVINNLLNDAINRPDKAEENAKLANAYLQLVPADMQADVRKEIHASRDPSIYSRLVRQRERRELIDNIVEDEGIGE